MNGGFQLVVGQAVEHIADVDHDLVGQGRDGNPLTIAPQHFQSFRAGPHQQSDEVDVAVGGRPHRAFG